MSAITQISSIYSACKDRIDAQRHIVRSIGSLASGNLAGALLGAVGGIIVARFIAPEVNGQFRLFTIPLMYMTFFHFGTFDGLSRHIPFYIGRNQPEHVEKLASAAGAWNLGVTSIVASGFLLCALWGLLHGNHVAAAGWFSQTLVCAGVFYGGYLGSTYRTLHNFVVLARIQFIQASIAFCLVLTVVFWGFYGLCLRSAVPIIFGVWLLHRARPLRMRLSFGESLDLGFFGVFGLFMFFFGLFGLFNGLCLFDFGRRPEGQALGKFQPQAGSLQERLAVHFDTIAKAAFIGNFGDDFPVG